MVESPADSVQQSNAHMSVHHREHCTVHGVVLCLHVSELTRNK